MHVFECIQGENMSYEKTNHHCENKEWELVIPTELFKENKAKLGEDPSWMLHVSTDKMYVAWNEEYLNYYRRDERSERDFSYEDRINKTPPLQLLQEGRFDLFAVDKTGWNGTMVDVHDKPLLKHIHFSYIDNRMREDEYDLEKALEAFQQNPQVREPEIIDIPYYNSEKNKRQSIEFYFVPNSDKEFQEIQAIKDSFFRNQYILEALLDIEKFKRDEPIANEKDDDDNDYYDND